MNKRGKKPLWEELDISSKLNSIRGWTLQGSTDTEIMEMLGVKKDTFYKWKKEHSDFAEAIKRGKDIANGEILNAAFKQSVGYYVPVEKPMKLKDQFGNEYIEMVQYNEYIPPNQTMAIFMLKNRLPQHYKDKQHIEHGGTVGMMSLDYMTDEELEKERKKLGLNE